MGADKVLLVEPVIMFEKEGQTSCLSIANCLYNLFYPRKGIRHYKAQFILNLSYYDFKYNVTGKGKN